MEKLEPYKGIAGIYEEIRPSYPEELIQDIIMKANLKPEDRLLEIGAGTGKATLQFANKGYKIHAVELGEDMAEILKAKCAGCPDVLVEVMPFEEWNCPVNQKYDMVYCAQAFHWIDPAIKYKKCHGLLKDDGCLVLFWYSPCDDCLPETKEIREKIDQIVKRYVSRHTVNQEKKQRLEHDGVYIQDERKAEIESSGLFRLVEKKEYIHEIKNSAGQYLKAMKSVPAFASLLDNLETEAIDKMDREITEVINTYGGYVGTVFKFTLYIAKKIKFL